MQRRDFMRAMLAATAMPSALMAQTVTPTQTRTGPPAPGPVPWMQGLDQAQLESVATLMPEEIADTSTTFFHPQQMATLSRFSDLLMPPLRGYPGAKAAEVPEFLDFYVSESSDEVKRLYQTGLDWLDDASRRRYKRAFAGLSATEADALIRPFLSTWMTDHYPTEPHQRFVNAVHQDVRLATINSQAWADASAKGSDRAPRMDMYWSPVEPDLHRDKSAAVDRTTREVKH